MLFFLREFEKRVTLSCLFRRSDRERTIERFQFSIFDILSINYDSSASRFTLKFQFLIIDTRPISNHFPLSNRLLSDQILPDSRDERDTRVDPIADTSIRRATTRIPMLSRVGRRGGRKGGGGARQPAELALGSPSSQGVASPPPLFYKLP